MGLVAWVIAVARKNGVSLFDKSFINTHVAVGFPRAEHGGGEMRVVGRVGEMLRFQTEGGAETVGFA